MVVSQHPGESGALDLAGRAPGQVGKDMDAIASPEDSEPSATVGGELLDGHRRVLREADGDLDALAVVPAGSGERRLDDIGVGVECIIHFPEGDVLASRLMQASRLRDLHTLGTMGLDRNEAGPLPCGRLSCPDLRCRPMSARRTRSRGVLSDGRLSMIGGALENSCDLSEPAAKPPAALPRSQHVGRRSGRFCPMAGFRGHRTTGVTRPFVSA